MKKLIPILLALLLLSACGAHGTAGQPTDTQPPETEAPAAPEATEETAAPETEIPATEETTGEPVDSTVTLDGLDSYLRLTLPEGWTWVDEGAAYGQHSILLKAPTGDFEIRAVYWDVFGMCGTGVSFEDITLPNGMKATLAAEETSDMVWQTLILPPNPDQFTLQINAPQTQIDAHRAELDEILASLQIGVLAHLTPVTPSEADK